MICKYSKVKIYLLLSTYKCVNQQLIFKVFEDICKQEETNFDFTNQIQKKIRSALTYLNAKWKIIGRKRIASKKYIEELSKTFYELFKKR